MQSTSHPHQSSPAPQEQDSARLAALLTLQDIEEIEALERNKHRAGVPLTDAELALTLFAKEARSSLVIENDRLIAQRLQEMENGQDMPMGTAGTSLQQPRSVGPTTPSHRLDGQHSLSQ
ncbi:hypothetical protein AX16_001009 [Volvariella volvacea WC 439]|nr:hypothetical protein AX16_001009 [Volvariella volvacea WC 439]